MADVLISIVSHGQASLVEDLLSSIDCHFDAGFHNVVVVVTENLFSEVVYYSSRFPIKIIYNLRPKGFGANHNAVFENFKSDFFFIVNPDIKLIDTFDVSEVISVLESRKIDIASPVILGTGGSIEDYKRSDLTVLNLIKRKFLRNGVEKFEWFAGMFLIVRSNCYRELGGFDPKFFMYVEDCDFCMRARLVNKNIDDLTDVAVVHDARRSSRRSLRHFKLHLSSLVKYLFST